jgi:Bacterial PH domain
VNTGALRSGAGSDRADPYREALEPVRGMLRADEYIISEIAGAVGIRSSEERFYESLTSQGHGGVVCTNQRLIAHTKFLLGITTTVIFEFANITEIAVEKAFTTELLITEQTAGRTRSVRITGEAYRSREAFCFALKKLV